MLAAIIQNLQNGPSQRVLPGILKIDHGGGGPLVDPDFRYDVSDFMTVLAGFPELAGEDPVQRAARRTRYLIDNLAEAKRLREIREGAAFLAGATVAGNIVSAQAAAEAEALRAEIAALAQPPPPPSPGPALAPAPAPYQRGQGHIPMRVAALLLAGAGVLLAVRLASLSRARADREELEFQFFGG